MMENKERIENNEFPTSKTVEFMPEEPYENEERIVQKPVNMSPGAVKLRSWLNKTLGIEMSDGRVLVGVFLCTDRDANVILGSCSEYLPEEGSIEPSSNGDNSNIEEPRMLGLVMIPGKHIVSINIDLNDTNSENSTNKPLNSEIENKDIT